MIVYADVLFLVNLLADFSLLSAVSRLWHLAAPRWRLLCGAAAGAACAVLSVAVVLPAWAGFLMTLPACACTVAAAFCPCSGRTFLRAGAGFFLFSFLLAGMLLLIWQIWQPPGLYIQNNVVYYPVSLPLFFVLLCLFYVLLVLLTRCAGEPAAQRRFCRLCVSVNGTGAVVDTKLDTGCALREPFSGLPVMVADARALASVLPPSVQACLHNGVPDAGVRLVPFETLGGRGLLPAFRADVRTAEGEEVQCWVAVSEKPLGGAGFAAVIDPAALETASV